MSTSGQSTPKYGCSGEGLSAVRMPRPRARRSAASVVSAQRLPCIASRSPVTAPWSAARAMSGLNADAASRVVITAFSPASAIRMIDRSVSTPSISTSLASSGSAASRRAISSPRAPGPIAAAKVHASPVRAMAIAWFAPLPPRSFDRVRPKIDAPGRGRSAIDRVSSRATLPMTKAFIPRSLLPERF